jgi:hypothetical protein
MAGKRVNLTDRAVAALKAAPAGKRIALSDAIVPGLHVRVTDKGAKSFVLLQRIPPSRNPVRRTLGAVGKLTLAEAREKARAWLATIKGGVDPRDAEAESQRRVEERRQQTFGAIMEHYLTRHVRGQRRAADVEREMRRELMPVGASASYNHNARRRSEHGG